MLTNTELNKKFEELISKKEEVQKIEMVIRDVTGDLNIKIANENVKLLEDLIEQTGQYKVRKNDYVASWEGLKKQLVHIGFKENVANEMLGSLKYENWK